MVAQWNKGGGVCSDVVLEGLVFTDLGADFTVVFLVSDVSGASVGLVKSTNGDWSDGSLGDVNDGFLEGVGFHPGGEELAGGKSFTPDDLEGSSVSGGKGVFGSNFGGTNFDAGEVDFLLSGKEESIDSLSNNGEAGDLREEGLVGVGGEGESWESSTSVEWGLVSSELWGVGVVVTVDGESVVVVEEGDQRSGEGGGGVGVRGEGLGV